MDNAKIIDKIKKCLALANSSNPNEAATALRQAQILMDKYGIDHPELLAAGVSAEWVKSGAAKTPPAYEAGLANLVGNAFACKILFSGKFNGRSFEIEGGYKFIGCAPNPEVASYTYTVLVRQLRKARSEYIKTKLKRCGPKSKTARADQFCEGWVYAIRSKIQTVAPTPEQAQAIEAYFEKYIGETRSLEPRQHATRGANDDGHAGYVAGKNAVLNRGVGTPDQLLALE